MFLMLIVLFSTIVENYGAEILSVSVYKGDDISLDMKGARQELFSSVETNSVNLFPKGFL